MNSGDEYNAWNPGLTSTIPPHLLPLITLFRPENGKVSYQQAKEAILNGTHPVRLDDSVQFAAMQVQVQFGDHRETTHKAGFLE